MSFFASFPHTRNEAFCFCGCGLYLQPAEKQGAQSRAQPAGYTCSPRRNGCGLYLQPAQKVEREIP